MFAFKPIHKEQHQKKKQYLKRDLVKFHKTVLTRNSYLRFEKEIDTWTNISQLWLFICSKTKLKTTLLFEKIYITKYFYKIYIICKKNVFIWEKKFYIEFFFTEKNFFCREKYKWKCKNIYISFEKYIFMQKMFVLQIKYKSFLNIYSFCKKIFFDHKKYIC